MTGPPEDDFLLSRREFAAFGVTPFFLQPTTEGGEEVSEPEVLRTYEFSEKDHLIVLDVDSDVVYVGAGNRVLAVPVDGDGVHWERYFDHAMQLVESTSDVLVLAGIRFGPTESSTHVLDRQDGSERWQADMRVRDASERMVYQQDSDTLFAQRIQSGEVAWSRTFEHAPVKSVWTPADRELICVLTDDGLYGLDEETGERQWLTDFDVHSTDLLNGVSLHFPFNRSSLPSTLAYLWDRREDILHAVSTEDGEERWQTDLGIFDEARYVTADDDTVYVGGRQRVVALATADGEQRWKQEVENRGPDPIMKDGTLYFSGRENVVAVDTADGETRWELEGEGDSFLIVTDVNDYVGIAAGRESTYAFDPNDGTIHWKATNAPRRSSPVLTDDAAYVSVGDGEVHAFAVPKPTLFDHAVKGLPFIGAGLAGAMLESAYQEYTLGDLPPLASMPMTSLEDFELEARVGGEAVAVHRAHLTADREERPVLVLQPDTMDVDTFESAADIWAGFDVQGVLPMFAHGSDPEPWAAIEHVSGRSLGSHAPVETTVAANAVATVAETVHAAHRDDLVHGSLHPDSVRFRDGDLESVVVGDWGFPARDDDPCTPPEGEGVAGDVYRLGALLYVALTGEPPDDNPCVEGDVNDVVTKALAADPEARYDSALAFRDDLRWAAFVR